MSKIRKRIFNKEGELENEVELPFTSVQLRDMNLENELLKIRSTNSYVEVKTANEDTFEFVNLNTDGAIVLSKID